MVSGPAIIGIAKGVKDISERFLISAFTLSFFIPLCFLNSPVNNEKPDESIIKPPAMFREFNVIPKKIKINFPAKKEINKIINTFSDVQNAIFFRSIVVCSFDKPTNIGTVPKGFITENNAPKNIINNSIIFLGKTCVFKILLEKGFMKLLLRYITGDLILKK